VRSFFYQKNISHDAAQLATHLKPEVIPALQEFMQRFEASDGTQLAIAAAMKETLSQHGLKMPALAMPIRYALFATTQTPAIDAVMALMGKKETLARLQNCLKIG